MTSHTTVKIYHAAQISSDFIQFGICAGIFFFLFGLTLVCFAFKSKCKGS
ncbi:hypothetical protein [Spirobacillus cienkowskii]|uniref:DUF2367 domain-containing protein n=1 Tax=Spirobacillus cienkowskii TaxID=495820 RepID=A0A369KLJ6_9BACT|nr:MAG: DUF2367 domain-containing protein [Spirobacillus cienkowskii]